MKHLLKTFAFLMLVVGWTSCSNKKKHITAQPEMVFAVDTSLVDKPMQDTFLHIAYRLPEQWRDMTNDQQVQQALAESNKEMPVRLVQLAGDSSAGLALSLTDIRQVPDSLYSQLKTNYRQILNAGGQWDSVSADSFTKDGFLVHQYMMANKEQVNFRLVFFRQEKPYAQVDFHTPSNSSFAAHTRVFESVIGSIKLKS